MLTYVDLDLFRVIVAFVQTWHDECLDIANRFDSRKYGVRGAGATDGSLICFHHDRVVVPI